MNDGLRSPELFHHLLDHSETYRAIVVSPYLFWTTFAAGQIAPDRTIVRPCLHDEPYARFELFQPLVNGAAGLWFFTEPERDLASALFRLPARTDITGDGVPVPECYDPEGFRARHGLGAKRFVLYGGRREGAKGWDGLLDSVRRHGPQGGRRSHAGHVRRRRRRAPAGRRRPGDRPRPHQRRRA